MIRAGLIGFGLVAASFTPLCFLPSKASNWPPLSNAPHKAAERYRASPLTARLTRCWPTPRSRSSS